MSLPEYSPRYYHRDGRRADGIEAAYTGSDPVVARTSVGDVEVSTVFLFIDHGRGTGDPILFETMLFCDDDNDPRHNELTRYSTEAQAKAGHQATVEALRAGRNPEWVQACEDRARGGEEGGSAGDSARHHPRLRRRR